MASVFKRGKKWLASFKDQTGQWRCRSTETSDKADAQRLADAWGNEARNIREGFADPRQKSMKAEQARTIQDHVADFETMLRNKGNVKQHVKQTAEQVRRIVADTKATYLSDLTADKVERAVAAMKDTGRSLRTCNSYIRSIKSFSAWLERAGRVCRNELKHLSVYNESTDPRRERRDLSPDELVRIIQAAQKGPVHLGLEGKTRSMAYLLAVSTGLRVAEIRSLTRQSFDFQADPPTITVSAAYSKHRRQDVQPLQPDVADCIRGWIGNREGQLFHLPGHTADMLKFDMHRARVQWQWDAKVPQERKTRREDGSFLCPVDVAGRYADFHAQRHTFISRVVESGASVKVCQTLARHSSPVLTIGRYAHTRLHDLTAALPAMPAVQIQAEAVELARTGTDDAKPAPGGAE